MTKRRVGQMPRIRTITKVPALGREAAVNRHLENLTMRNLRVWTIYNRQCALARLASWADSPILHLTEADLKRWQVKRATQLQPEPRRTELSHARQFYRWAVAEGLITADPSVKIPLPRVARGLPRPMREADVLTALECADDVTKAIIALAAYAGLRACEIAGLDWSEVGLGDRSPHIRIVDGKGGHGRLVPLSTALSAVLRMLPYRRGPVIRRLDGRPGPCAVHRISSRANDYLHDLGIMETLHQLRHRFATAAYGASRDIRAVQELLGHASPTTTSRYAAVASGVAIAAVEAAGTIQGPAGRRAMTGPSGLRLVTGGFVRKHTDGDVLDSFELHMRTAKISPVTIDKRIELLGRLATFLVPTGLLDATPADLERWQQSHAHLAATSLDIYSRHTVELYRWAVRTERLATDPTTRMVSVRVTRGLPHPISEPDLRAVLAAAPAPLRLIYILAAFAGLRRGEICRLRVEDLALDAPQPVALVRGKGAHERHVPLLPPVAAELRNLRLPRRGIVVQHKGEPYNPERLSCNSHNFMRSIGVESTLHSLRHYFATQVVRLTRDILLVRDLLGHSSVHTTQVYMSSTIDGAHERLADFSEAAQSLIDNKQAAPGIGKALADFAAPLRKKEFDP